MKIVLILLVAIIALSTQSHLVNAQEENILEVESPQDSMMEEGKGLETDDVKTATPSPIVKYELAFPGMLPDHPFYKLKVFRNKIAATLISDPIKKIEFFLKQTDKGILATAMLVDKGKIDLAAETALKAEHNFTLLNQQVEFQPRRIDNDHMELIETAALKHQEVLLYLANHRVPEDKKKIFLTVADFSKRNLQSIKEHRNAAFSDKNRDQNR